MVLFHRVAAIAAIGLFGTSANALTKEECSAQYKAEIAARKVVMTWADYQAKLCGIDPKASAPTKPPASKKH